MSLGLTRDSIGNLSGLDKSFGKDLDFDDDDDVLDSSQISQEEGDLSAVHIGNPSDRSTAPAKPAPKVEIKKESEPSKSDTTKADSDDPASSYGNYSGFSAEYADYSNYGVTYSDTYSNSVLGQKKGNGIWCCLFPWAVNTSKIEEGPDDEKSQASEIESAKSDDEQSTGSAAYGEKLTENERAAVLARLRLASPKAADPETPETPPKQKGLLNELDSYEGGVEESKEDAEVLEEKEEGPKSILRHSSRQPPATPQPPVSKKSAADKDGRRRSLFPQQYEKKPKTAKSVHFSPMARVVTVKSKNEMSGLEKAMVWWQKPDYDDFKKTGRIIARAMCEGGSEIWLTTNNAWASRGSGKASQQAIHSHDRSEIERGRSGNISPTNGDKWWHTFGHSRRGLEHIASVEEGRQRQANVRIAIRIIIDEQRRQKIYRKEDPEKLRMLSLQYTTWARELALAAAASDAAAVEANFDEKRKSREYFILKNAKEHGGFAKKLPSFMMPVGRSPQVLDHHTSTQVRYRRKQSLKPTQPQKPNESNAGSSEPINDSNDGSNLSKQAAGFGTLDADVSAILSGLGAVNGGEMPALKPQAASVGAH